MTDRSAVGRVYVTSSEPTKLPWSFAVTLRTLSPTFRARDAVHHCQSSFAPVQPDGALCCAVTSEKLEDTSVEFSVNVSLAMDGLGYAEQIDTVTSMNLPPV